MGKFSAKFKIAEFVPDRWGKTFITDTTAKRNICVSTPQSLTLKACNQAKIRESMHKMYTTFGLQYHGSFSFNFWEF